MQAESAAEVPALTIARLDKTKHDRSEFSCGFAPIDNFLKLSLSEHVKPGLVTAWVATEGDDPSVLDFYPLEAMADLSPNAWKRSGVPDIPVVYIRAVTVHEARQGAKLWQALLIDAMRRCVRISEEMGAAAITFDVLEDENFERRWAFYECLGFVSLGDPENPKRVYITMADVRKSLK